MSTIYILVLLLQIKPHISKPHNTAHYCFRLFTKERLYYSCRLYIIS